MSGTATGAGTFQAAALVVGGGGAGLRAALAAQESLEQAGRYDSERPVVLVTKGRLGQSGVTALACSDRMAFHATLPYTAPGTPDNWRYHAEDIYRIGGCVSDADLAQVLAKNSGAAAEYLAGLEVPFARTADGRFAQFVTDGSEYPRALYTGPHTANHIEQALVAAVRRTPVVVREETMLVDVALDREGRVAGAWLLAGVAPGREGPVFCATSAVVLATGGAGEAFAVNVFPPGQTGDGWAAAYRAGAALVNLEFIQIGLCSTLTKLACSGSLMRAVPRFVNDRGEEFLARYFPSGTTPAELAAHVFRKGASWPVSYEHPTHRLDVAVAQEVLAGRRVFLDYRQNPAGFSWADLPADLVTRYEREAAAAAGAEGRTRSPDRATPLGRLQEINPPVLEWFRVRHLRLADGDRIEIAPAIQHFEGGVKIDRHGETTVPGLFAAGETAGGQHGANRPGGNALLDAQVFGRLAGEAAARRATESPAPAPVPEGPAPAGTGGDPRARVTGPGGRTASEVRELVRAIAYRSAGVIRTEAGLEEGLAELAELAREGVRADGKGLAYALETGNLLLSAELVLRTCAERKESRGPHLFFSEVSPQAVPLPRRDPELQVYFVVRQQAGRLTVAPASPVRWAETGEVE